MKPRHRDGSSAARLALDKEIERTQARLRALHERREDLARKETLEGYSYEAIRISTGLDDWVSADPVDPHGDVPAKALFLGACSGEWAARSRYRGELPGFGGFLLCLAGKRILIDPGNQSFSTLLAEGYHPSHLDHVVVTHSHWDCVRDLEPILMAANPISETAKSKSGRVLSLLADPSVIFGIPMNVETILRSASTNMIVTEDHRTRLESFQFSNPSAVSVFDLFVRLRGRYQPIEIGKRYDLGAGVSLRTRASYHAVSWGQTNIPALDFTLSSSGSRIRIVYLSDTEYRPTLAEVYREDVATQGPISLLICNVKTLDVFPYDKGELMGFTRKHLGWRGVVQLTKDMQKNGLLRPDSLVVLRAWGLETVTELDATDQAMVARPDKLATYEQRFAQETGQPCVVPGVSWVAIPASGQPAVFHRRPPFLAQGDIRKFGSIYYVSALMDAVVRKARAPTDSLEAIVLITGETGTGKDVLARSIHIEGHRPGPFVSHTASELTSELAESELFGSAKGAYTGSIEDKRGWLEEASGGTLVIQEFAEMPMAHQKLFLRVLQERLFHPVRGSKEVRFDARFIATTNLTIHDAVSSGTFREDLFRRFVYVIEVPPLRERPEDIPAILAGWRAERGKKILVPASIDPSIIKLLQSYSWPGNVRQLENMIESIGHSGDWSSSHIRHLLEQAQSSSRDTIPTGAASHQLDETDLAILVLLGKGARMNRRSLQAALPDIPPTKLVYHLGKLGRARLVKQLGAARNTEYIKAPADFKTPTDRNA